MLFLTANNRFWAKNSQLEIITVTNSNNKWNKKIYYLFLKSKLFAYSFVFTYKCKYITRIYIYIYIFGWHPWLRNTCCYSLLQSRPVQLHSALWASSQSLHTGSTGLSPLCTLYNNKKWPSQEKIDIHRSKSKKKKHFQEMPWKRYTRNFKARKIL